MSKRIVLGLVSAFLILSMATMGIQTSPVRADDATEAPDDVAPVAVEISGTVASVTPHGNGAVTVVLEDGTEIVVNHATDGGDAIEVGQSFTFIANIDDDGDGLTAKTVTLDEPEATETVDPNATPEPTLDPSATPAATTEAATCGGPNAHPVATRLSDAFGVPYDEVMGLHCGGMGFGNIARAYQLAEKTGKSVDEILAMLADGGGWGKIMKDAGIKPNELAPGQVIKGHKHGDATETADDGSTTQKGKGNGKGNSGKGGGKGNKDNKGGGKKGN